MPYSPPAWNAAALPFRGGYTAPAWNAAAIEFRPANAGTRQAQTSAGSAQIITPATGSSAQAQTTDGSATFFARRPVLYAQAGMRWTRGTPMDHHARIGWTNGTPLDPQLRLPWAPPAARDRIIQLPWARPAATDAERRLPITPGDARDAQTRMRWSASRPRDSERRARWGHARYPHGVQRSIPWTNPPPRDQQRRAPWAPATPADHQIGLATGRALPRDPQARAPWGMGQRPPQQWRPIPPYIPPPGPAPAPPCYVPPDWDAARIRFERRNAYAPPAWHAAAIPFACDNRYFRITRSLRLSHSLAVVRLPDRLALAVTAVSISTDRDSWAWTFSIRFADRASLIAVAPSPAGVVSVEITLDGYVWTALIESYQEDRQLARQSASASGRSRTAVLAAPYDAERAYTHPAPATAQQLALRELDFTGFALDWQLIDWTIPAGAWAYERETHMGAITRIAASAGGIVQAAPGTDTVIVAPRYPVVPWEIAAATPDITLEAGSSINLGKRYIAGPGYQGVYISGRDQGVRVNVYRDGTGGSPYAELVVDPLITDIAPAVARGKAVLTDATTREEISLLLPMTPSPAAPGLLTPGTVLAVEDPTWGTYRAVVTGSTIDAEVSADGAITARQSVQIERYISG